MTTYATSERLVLRDFELTDVDALQAIYGDERVTKYMSFQPRSQEQVQGTIEGIVERRGAKPRTEYALAGVLRSTGEVVAMIRLASDDKGGMQVGFALHADHWNQGLGKELAELGLRYAFEVLNVKRVWGARDANNKASEKTLRAVGMSDQDFTSVSVEQPDGSRSDRRSPVAGITRNEWLTRHPEISLGSGSFASTAVNGSSKLRTDSGIQFLGL